MFWQPAATVKVTLALAPVMAIAPDLTMPEDGQVGGGGLQPCFATVTECAAPGESPLPQRATSCTLTMTLDALPAEKVPANEKPLALPNWPFSTWVYEPPLSYEAQTR